VQDLSGKEVYVRKSSSYHESLEKLNTKLAKAGKARVKVRVAPEEIEDENILEMVNAGLVKATIVDEHIAEFWGHLFAVHNLLPYTVIDDKTIELGRIPEPKAPGL
jgi:membrane-bound lytic murein transglycosylase MltF